MKQSITTLLALFSLILFGCAQYPDTRVTRHQIDDLADDDRDGVINQRDLCSDTPQRSAANFDGCSQWQSIISVDAKNIIFDFDHDQIRSDQKTKINQLLVWLNQHPQRELVLIGDTSSEGNSEYNQSLAKRRTQMIKQELVSQGIIPSRIIEQEYFEQTRFTAQMKQRKRRVIAVLSEEQLVPVESWTIYSSDQAFPHQEVK